MDLINELLEKINLLGKAIEELKKRGHRLSQAEADYKVAMAEKILDLRDKGNPVTIIPDLARGNFDISRLRLKRDIAEVDYQTNQEYINFLKLSIRILDSQLSREWTNTGGSK